MFTGVIGCEYIVLFGFCVPVVIIVSATFICSLALFTYSVLETLVYYHYDSHWHRWYRLARTSSPVFALASTTMTTMMTTITIAISRSHDIVRNWDRISCVDICTTCICRWFSVIVNVSTGESMNSCLDSLCFTFKL